MPGFPHDRLQPFADDGTSEFLGRDLRKVGEIDVLVLHPVDPIPITLGLWRSSSALHGVLSFSSRSSEIPHPRTHSKSRSCLRRFSFCLALTLSPFDSARRVPSTPSLTP